jgi:hypothetical protein
MALPFVTFRAYHRLAYERGVERVNERLASQRNERERQRKLEQQGK